MKKLYILLLLIPSLSSAYRTIYWNWKRIDPFAINFPQNFMWGATTISYEAEGYSTDNTWYASTESRTDIAVDHWNNYQEDIQLLKELGLNTYCFSIAWDKIEPHEGYFDEAALQHYVDLCDVLIKNNIEPIVILKDHFDPLWFAYNGGFEKEENIHYFIRYTKKVFTALQHNVRKFITFWAPDAYAANGYYLAKNPPHKKQMHLFALVYKNTLQAHVQTYKELKNMPGGNNTKIGITKHVHPLEPWNYINPLDHVACNVARSLFDTPFYQFFTTGIFSIRLPIPTPSYFANVYHENMYAPKSVDFIGINHHSHGYMNNFKHVHNRDEIPTDISSITVYPEGLYFAIQDIANNMAKQLDIPIIITQNGIATKDESLRDLYLKRYIYTISKAIDDGYNVEGYCYWSLLDGFMYNSYDNHFGLISVDHQNNLKRTIKKGAQYLKKVIQ